MRLNRCLNLDLDLFFDNYAALAPVSLTSGLEGFVGKVSDSTSAVALTACASSCSTSLWVLATSRILGGETRRTRKKLLWSLTLLTYQLFSYLWHSKDNHLFTVNLPPLILDVEPAWHIRESSFQSHREGSVPPKYTAQKNKGNA